MRTSILGLVSAHLALHVVFTLTECGSLSDPHSGQEVDDGQESKIFCDYYNDWSAWSKCNKHCVQSRKRLCKFPETCGQSRIKEKRACNKKYRPCKEVTYKVINSDKNNRKKEGLLYDLFYKPWTPWGSCSKACKKRRRRRCKGQFKDVCGGGYLEEERSCKKDNSSCHAVYTLNIKSYKSSRHVELGAQEANYTWKMLRSMCGDRMPGASGSYRIVGGRNSEPHSWPWQVTLLNRKKKHLCGGTLIAPTWVLTAAHCILKGGRRRRVVVRVGEHDKSVTTSFQKDHKVKKYFPHASFKYDLVVNDIALLQLKVPVKHSNVTGFACLPTKSNKVRHRTLCKIMGWGRTEEKNSKGSNVLKEAEVPIVKKKKCKKAFSFPVTNSQLCAGYRKGGIDSCIGDSGGPLMCPFFTNASDTVRWFVNGVTSYGEGCGDKGKFGIYTNVSKYINWIKKIIEQK